MAGALLLVMLSAGTASALTNKQTLGKAIFFDARLSTPDGLACAGCHTPAAGWADPDLTLPVSGGIIPGDYGDRSAPSAAYAATSPTFFVCDACGECVGGQFWAVHAIDQLRGQPRDGLEQVA